MKWKTVLVYRTPIFHRFSHLYSRLYGIKNEPFSHITFYAQIIIQNRKKPYFDACDKITDNSQF